MPIMPIVRGALGAHGRPCHADSRCRKGRAGVPVFHPQSAGAGGAGLAGEGELRSQGSVQSGAHGLTMQTNFTLAQLADPETARSEHDPAQVRALRLLHRDLPDLRAAGRRARQPARAHLSHQGDAGGRPRADGVGGQARRPLPVVPRLHDDLPVGRATTCTWSITAGITSRSTFQAAAAGSAAARRCWPG